MLMQADIRHNHTFTCNTDQESLQQGLPWWTDTGLRPGETESGTVPVLRGSMAPSTWQHICLVASATTLGGLRPWEELLA